MIRTLEQDTQQGLYDMPFNVQVVQHPRHGRLLLTQGWGGMDSPKGGAYRWEHGAAYQLQAEDTLESLRSEEWNDYTSLYEAVLRGYDDSRPVLEWDGNMVAALATSVAVEAR